MMVVTIVSTIVMMMAAMTIDFGLKNESYLACTVVVMMWHDSVQ